MTMPVYKDRIPEGFIDTGNAVYGEVHIPQQVIVTRVDKNRQILSKVFFVKLGTLIVLMEEIYPGPPTYLN